MSFLILLPFFISAVLAQETQFFMEGTLAEPVPEIVQAALRKDSSRVKTLISEGADPQTTFDVWKEMEGVDLEIVRIRQSKTLFQAVIETENQELAVFLLENGAFSPGVFNSCFSRVVLKNETKAAQKLLELQKPEKSQLRDAFSQGVSNDSFECVRLLYEYVEDPGMLGVPFYHVKSPEMIHLLASLGFDVNDSYENLFSPLELLANDSKLAAAFIEEGATEPAVPLVWVDPKNKEAVRFWKNRGAKYFDLNDEQKFTTLRNALPFTETLRELQKDGLDPVSVSEAGDTLLHFIV